MDERPVTRAELLEVLSSFQAELKAELRAELATLKQEIVESKQEILDTVQEQVRDSQTEILKAFLPFREDTSIRFRAIDAKIGNTEAELRARMDVIDRRLGQIETKLLLDPPAA